MASRSLGCFLAGDFADAVRDRRMQLWLAHTGPAIEAVLLTEVVDFPRRKALQHVACVGRNYRRWVELRKIVDEWGRAQGCTLVRMISPRKWLRANPDLKEWHVIAVKELD